MMKHTTSLSRNEVRKLTREVLPVAFRSSVVNALCCLLLAALTVFMLAYAAMGGWQSTLHFLPESRPDMKKEQKESHMPCLFPLEDSWNRAVYIRALRELGVEL